MLFAEGEMEMTEFCDVGGEELEIYVVVAWIWI